MRVTCLSRARLGVTHLATNCMPPGGARQASAAESGQLRTSASAAARSAGPERDATLLSIAHPEGETQQRLLRETAAAKCAVQLPAWLSRSALRAAVGRRVGGPVSNRLWGGMSLQAAARGWSGVGCGIQGRLVNQESYVDGQQGLKFSLETSYWKECHVWRRLGDVADLAEAGAAWTRGRGGRALGAAAWAEVFCGRACSGEWVHADPLLGWLDACARPPARALSCLSALALALRAAVAAACRSRAWRATARAHAQAGARGGRGGARRPAGVLRRVCRRRRQGCDRQARGSPRSTAGCAVTLTKHAGVLGRHFSVVWGGRPRALSSAVSRRRRMRACHRRSAGLLLQLPMAPWACQCYSGAGMFPTCAR